MDIVLSDVHQGVEVKQRPPCIQWRAQPSLYPVACPALPVSSGVPRNFVREGEEVQQIQLRTERMGIWGR